MSSFYFISVFFFSFCNINNIIFLSVTCVIFNKLFEKKTVCAVADESHLYAIGGNSVIGLVNIAERFDPKKKGVVYDCPNSRKTKRCRKCLCLEA